jgi:hypothetical protein
MLKEPPRKKNTGGRPGIDWDELHERWLTQVSYRTIEAFLASYGIDATAKRVKTTIKDWVEKPTPEPVTEAEIIPATEIDNDTLLDYEERVRKVQTMIRTWRAHQAEADYRVGNKLRVLVEAQLARLQEKMDQGEEIKTYELVNLAKTLETIQRIQRLSLGMSTDNVGIEDARKLAEEQAGEEQQDDTPVFSVEVNENGKFTRLRPRRVK